MLYFLSRSKPAHISLRELHVYSSQMFKKLKTDKILYAG